MSALQCYGTAAPPELSLFTATINVIISVVAIIGNILIVVLVLKDPLKKLYTPFNYFVVNLAISDLVVGSISQPLSVYVHILEYTGSLDNKTAKVYHVTFFISVTASILSLIAISVDRFVAITYPLKYRAHLSFARCLLISVGIWLFSLILPFTYYEVGFIDYLTIYTNTAITVTFVILVFIYIKIYKFLRKHTQQMMAQSNTTTSEESNLKHLLIEKRVTRVFLIVLVLFIATYLPATIMTYILQYSSNWSCNSRHWLRDSSILLIAINSCMNPFVYTIRLKPFRQSIRHIYKSFTSNRIHPSSSGNN